MSLGVSLGETLTGMLDRIEQQERWVIESAGFGRKLKEYHKHLMRRRSPQRMREMVTHFANVGAFVNFREMLELMRALSFCNDAVLRRLLEAGMSGQGMGEGGEVWDVIRMRMAWLARANALMRVFGEERARLVELGIRKYRERRGSGDA